MAGQLHNIADFSDTFHRGRPAHPGGARLYQFPNRPACRAPVPERSEPSTEPPKISRGHRILALGIEVAAGLFIYAVWLVWHLHK